MNIKSFRAVVAGVALLGLFASGATFAATKAEISRSADRALTHFYTLNPANRALVAKAAVGVAGEYGEGVLQVQGHTVDYYSVASGSVGLTLGVASHREIILFMTQ